MASKSFTDVSSYEIGVILTGSTCGVMVAHKMFEPAISRFGLNFVTHAGFVFLVSANFALYFCISKITNNSVFSTCVFLSRLVSGFGSGLIDASCLISRIH